jgi:hypothetical protein
MNSRPMWRLPATFVTIAGACTTNEQELEMIAADPVAGTMGGVAWEVAASEYVITETSYEVALYASVPTEPCSPDVL